MPIKDVQVVNKQHAVPQNIMDVEFKIIGDLTMRQFAYLMLFGGASFVSFTYVGGIFKWPFGITFVLLGLGFAFVPIEDRGMDQWVVAFFKAIYSPTQKIWKKDIVLPSAFMYQNMAIVKQELITLAPTTSRRKLEEYLETQGKIETKFDKLDIQDKEYIQKVKDAFAGTVNATASDSGYYGGGNSVGVAVAEPVVEAPMPKMEPYIAPAPQDNGDNQEPVLPVESYPILSQSQPQTQTQTQPQPQVVSQIPSTPPVQAPLVVQDGTVTHSIVSTAPATSSSTPTVASETKPVYQPTSQPTPQTFAPTQQPTVSVQQPQTPVQRPQPKPNKYDIKPVRKKQEVEEFKLPNRRDRDLGGIISADRQAGRRFINLAANGTGQIVLPIRGEKKLKTSEEVDIELDINEKTDQLNKLIAQIKQEEGIKGFETPKEPVATAVAKPGQEVTQTMEQKEDFDIEANKVIETVKTQNTQLTKQIEQLKTEISSSASGISAQNSGLQNELAKLQQDKAKSDTEYEALLKQLKELQDKLKQKDSITPQLPSIHSGSSTIAQIQPLSTKPNVVSGVVKNAQGIALDGIVLIVKNNKGEAKRAVKTNSLGQFVLVTPLDNGMYTLEVGPYNKVSLTFDIISVEAKGQVIPPIEFVGK